MSELGVWLGPRRVGTLTTEGGRMSFAYAYTWLTGNDTFPISASLPLAADLDANVGHYFFANLLPEGNVRAAVCARLGISIGNDFELLRAIGGECAGALSIGEESTPVSATYEPIPDAELAELNRDSSSVASSFAGREGIRLSLAGAQDKLPVYVESGRLHVPVGNSPSSHILKLANRDFPHLPDNELLLSTVARNLNLRVADTTLHVLEDGTRLLLVERFDRTVDERGELVRRHQEDLCQALGLPPFSKYEDEGGPSFARCLDTVRGLSSEPMVDAERMLRWQIFNLLGGNSDGHAKNLSILYGPTGPRLAPAYDLVCTRAYPGLTRNLALAIGDERDPGQIGTKHWRAWTAGMGIGHRLVLGMVAAMVDEIVEVTRSTIATLAQQYGDSPAAERILRVVHEQARRTERLL